MTFGYYTFAVLTSAALSSLKSLILSFQLSSSHLSVTLILLNHVLQKHQDAILLPSTICHQHRGSAGCLTILALQVTTTVIVCVTLNCFTVNHISRMCKKHILLWLFLLLNPLKPELNSICYLLALLGAHHFLHVSRIRVKLLTLRRLMSYIYMEHPFLMFLDHTQRRSTVGRTPLDE